MQRKAMVFAGSVVGGYAAYRISKGHALPHSPDLTEVSRDLFSFGVFVALHRIFEVATARLHTPATRTHGTAQNDRRSAARTVDIGATRVVLETTRGGRIRMLSARIRDHSSNGVAVKLNDPAKLQAGAIVLVRSECSRITDRFLGKADICKLLGRTRAARVVYSSDGRVGLNVLD